jgi:hypothetical protein
MLAARPTPFPHSVAARPTLGLGFHTHIAASSAPSATPEAMGYHKRSSDTIGILFTTNPHPWSSSTSVHYHNAQLAHTIRIPYTTVSNTREVKRRHQPNVSLTLPIEEVKICVAALRAVGPLGCAKIWRCRPMGLRGLCS